MAIDLTSVSRKYKGLWVGLKKDQQTVVAAGKTAREALEKARKKGFAHPILFRVPTKVLPYIGAF